MAICSISFGDVLLRAYSWPSMIHLSGPLSCHPNSLRVAMTTATGPRACLPLPLSSSPCLSVL
eukprot:8245273-Heterocapsa_arctica.AAC.1